MSSLKVFSSDGGRKEISLFGTDQQIQVARFMLGSTTVELKSSHGADGSTTLDVLLRQTTQAPAPYPPPAPATPMPGLAAADVNAYPPLSQWSEVGGNPDQALLRGHVRSSTSEIELAQVTPLPRLDVKPRDVIPDGRAEVSSSAVKEDKDTAQLRGWIMMVATLFAGMTFQAGITPPGGYWQEDSDSNSYPALASTVPNSSNMSTAANATSFAIINLSPSISFIVLSSSGASLSNFNVSTAFYSQQNVTGHTYSAGESVWNDKRRGRYSYFYAANSVAFFYSLLLIFAILNEQIFHPVYSRTHLKLYTIIDIFLIWLSYTIGTTGNFLFLSFTLGFFGSVFGALLVRYLLDCMCKRSDPTEGPAALLPPTVPDQAALA